MSSRSREVGPVVHLLVGTVLPTGRITWPHPSHRPFVTATLHWGDGLIERAPGRAHGWDASSVLVDVESSRGHHYVWLRAGDVERRDVVSS